MKEHREYYAGYNAQFMAFKKKNRVTGLVLNHWVNKTYGGFQGLDGKHPNHHDMHSSSRFWNGGSIGRGIRESVYYYKPDEVKSFLKAQQKKAYSGLRNKKLSMNVIVFIGKSEKESKGRHQGNKDFHQSWDNEMESSAKKFVRDFSGKFRLLVSDSDAVYVYAKIDPKDAEKKLKLEEKVRKAEEKLKTEKNTFNIKDLKAKIASYKKLIAEL